MAGQLTMERLTEARGADVYDSDGDKIGAVEEIFYDQETNQPEWIGIGTGFFGTKRVLVPVEGAELGSRGVRVPYAKDQVKDSPDVDEDEISERRERDLYGYYGLQPSTERSDTVLPEGAPTAGEASVTRAEEELEVGKRDVDAGTARLRKWVETEPVSVDVDLHRETARVTREQLDEPVGEGEIGEEQIDVPLRGEEPMVRKQVVAKERIGVEKDVEVDRQTVGDELRKERVEVDGDNVTEGRR